MFSNLALHSCIRFCILSAPFLNSLLKGNGRYHTLLAYHFFLVFVHDWRVLSSLVSTMLDHTKFTLSIILSSYFCEIIQKNFSHGPFPCGERWLGIWTWNFPHCLFYYTFNSLITVHAKNRLEQAIEVFGLWCLYRFLLV